MEESRQQAEKVWTKAKSMLLKSEKHRIYQDYISSLKADALLENRLILLAPTELVRSKIEHDLDLQIKEALKEASGKDLECLLSVSRDRSAKQGSGVRDQLTHLDPQARFDNFISGTATAFAHAAAVSVSENPGEGYNPLFIYGNSGLGKTHLLNAIGNEVVSSQPEKKVFYVTSEEFTNEFIESVKENRGLAFNRKYRSFDVLLIDDIQFLATGNRIETQESFFNTFNALYGERKQVVVTSDVAPRQLGGMKERMITRFEQGLTVDVQPPEKETRVAILRMKAATSRLKVDIPDSVIDFIADQVTDNIRELEGALLRVIALTNLNHQSATVSLAGQALQDYFTGDVQVGPQEIMDCVAAYFRLSPSDLLSSKRGKEVASARQIAMYICREMTGLPLASIGQAFGGRDHTTVIHACQKISEEMTEKRMVYDQVSAISARLRRQL
ncbi:MAG: chromosomal replication initiator protein DnaA [Aeriscardovia sp.]|nr:chromosomal replication initiator protein DnaA [Aeriscardovia sp.]MBQ1424788.1 chromosomal replication initiator protein DnaA [Aeriscardovia sp.]MBQ5520625.1 chromosomal replication initiator protein DnaA [Aeriscardovia sp.]MBQ5556793.1 chromosomal replication initiator protein DnaA [Aeriscardovia sp.]MBQ5762450.1 chromosomal replication initiator protein DnaA [Aeriscardovia sp.]